MRRSIVGAVVVMALTVLSIGSATADSTSVQGTGSYERLVVKNGAEKLVFQVHAPGGECDIKYLAVHFRDRDGTEYQMDGGCYPGAAWAASLVRGAKLVDCSGFTLKYKTATGVWTGSIPRTCLKKLAGDVKVTESWVDDYSPTINEVPATKWVKRG